MKSEYHLLELQLKQVGFHPLTLRHSSLSALNADLTVRRTFSLKYRKLNNIEDTSAFYT